MMIYARAYSAARGDSPPSIPKHREPPMCKTDDCLHYARPPADALAGSPSGMCAIHEDEAAPGRELRRSRAFLDYLRKSEAAS